MQVAHRNCNGFNQKCKSPHLFIHSLISILMSKKSSNNSAKGSNSSKSSKATNSRKNSKSNNSQRVVGSTKSSPSFSENWYWQ